MNMTSAGFADLTEIVQEMADTVCQGRIVSLLEGGYDLEGLSTSVLAHLTRLSDSDDQI
jgi:acetoin utilization deacetylase AcuC-like enzyme